MTKIKNIPDPFKESSYKGFHLIPVLDPKALKTCKYTKVHKVSRIIYYNPFFTDKLSLGQKIFLAESNVREYKLRDIYKADEKAFYYVNKRYGVSEGEIGAMFKSMTFANKAHKKDRLFAFFLESQDHAAKRKFKEKIVRFFKNWVTWKKK